MVNFVLVRHGLLFCRQLDGQMRWRTPAVVIFRLSLVLIKENRKKIYYFLYWYDYYADTNHERKWHCRDSCKGCLQGVSKNKIVSLKSCLQIFKLQFCLLSLLLGSFRKANYVVNYDSILSILVLFCGKFIHLYW